MTSAVTPPAPLPSFLSQTPVSSPVVPVSPQATTATGSTPSIVSTESSQGSAPSQGSLTTSPISPPVSVQQVTPPGK